MKTLVVYYSRKGYTEKIALEKAKELSADFLCLETIENVAGYNGFINCLSSLFSKKDMELLPYDTDISAYEKVIICTPLWFSEPAAPVKTFMKREKHSIKNAEYIFVHASGDNAAKAYAYAEKTLRLTGSHYTSIQTVFGKIKKEEEF